VTILRRRRLVWALAARDEGKRQRAAAALVQVEDPGTVRRVRELLESRKREEGRATAAYVLGFSGAPDVADALARRLADTEESTVVRAYAAEALGHLLQHRPVLAEIRLAIGRGLRDPEPEVRFWSAFAAGALDLQESRPQLERLREDEAPIEGWWTVGEEANWALRCLDGEEDPPLPGPVPDEDAGGRNGHT
jgi:HEAT repeat protein